MGAGRGKVKEHAGGTMCLKRIARHNKVIFSFAWDKLLFGVSKFQHFAAFFSRGFG